jgi:hypothetical protein
MSSDSDENTTTYRLTSRDVDIAIKGREKGISYAVLAHMLGPSDHTIQKAVTRKIFIIKLPPK